MVGVGDLGDLDVTGLPGEEDRARSIWKLKEHVAGGPNSAAIRCPLAATESLGRFNLSARQLFQQTMPSQLEEEAELRDSDVGMLEQSWVDDGSHPAVLLRAG